MTNPRRRRSILVGFTVLVIALAQGPNLYFNVYRPLPDRRPRPDAGAQAVQEWKEQRAQQRAETLDTLVRVERYVPPLWVAAATAPVMDGRPLPGLAAFFGCMLLGLVGLQRAYAATLRFYRGGSGSTGKAVRPASHRAARTGSGGTSFLERGLPGLSEEAAAVALASFKSMIRSPELKLIWGVALFVPVLAGPGSLLRLNKLLPDGARPFIATATMAFTTFMLVQVFGNQFGFDRDGFRALVLSPVQRRALLVGKNLATLVPNALLALAPLVVVSLVMKLPVADFLACLFQLVALVLISGVIGNLLSIWLPYRFAPGSLKPTKLPTGAMLALVGCQMAFPMLISPIFAPPFAQWSWRLLGYSETVPVNLVVSPVLAGVAGLVYRLSLDPLGRLLQAREITILSRITVEVE